nr:TMV resistance protein N-like [Tanacetum cinerariifolium]
VLITGKDRQLLIAHGVKKVYDVELLHDDEAMELFNLYAFNHKQRKDDFRELSEQLVNRERLFKDTGPWLDIQSHENDSHIMHYVFQHQDCKCDSRHNEHHLAELKKNPNINATYNLYGFASAFKMSNPNVALISSPEEMSQAWFKASAEFIKGLDDQDGTFFQDDQVREKCIEQRNEICGDNEDGTLVDGVVGKICPKMNRMSVDDGDGVLDFHPQARSAAVSEFFAEFDALKKEVLLIK